MEKIGVCDLSRLKISLPFFSLNLYITYVEDLLAIGVTELSSFFFSYHSEGNRLFYMIPMLVFVFWFFFSVTFSYCMGTSGPVCGNF